MYTIILTDIEKPIAQNTIGFLFNYLLKSQYRN